MRKNKLYLILAIITSLTLFTTAAICNQCAVASAEEEENTIEESEVASEEAVEEEGSKTLESDEEEAAEEESDEEEPAEEEVTEEEEEIENIETEAPTINLEVYEGPTYSSTDDVCYYRIKANVTGIPTPSVEFSKDDSNGAWGSKKVQINLNDPSDTYNLTATATNSEGSDTDSINLSWGCPEPNNPPEIIDVILPGGDMYANLWYEIKVVVIDPDNDNLTYVWSLSEGIMDDPTANPLKWATQFTGPHEITVTVEDGKGGTTSRTFTVNTIDYLRVELNYITGESGEIEKEIAAYPGNYPYIGDSDNNKPVRGYFSYDITGLSGMAVVAAKFGNPDYLQNGDPYTLIEGVWLEVVDWGENDPLNVNDYDLPGILIKEFSGVTIGGFSNGSLDEELKKAVDAGKTRFQLRIRHKGYQTNNNLLWDGWRYTKYKLSIEYINVP